MSYNLRRRVSDSLYLFSGRLAFSEYESPIVGQRSNLTGELALYHVGAAIFCANPFLWEYFSFAPSEQRAIFTIRNGSNLLLFSADVPSSNASPVGDAYLKDSDISELDRRAEELPVAWSSSVEFNIICRSDLRGGELHVNSFALGALIPSTINLTGLIGPLAFAVAKTPPPQAIYVLDSNGVLFQQHTSATPLRLEQCLGCRLVGTGEDTAMGFPPNYNVSTPMLRLKGVAVSAFVGVSNLTTVFPCPNGYVTLSGTYFPPNTTYWVGISALTRFLHTDLAGSYTRPPESCGAWEGGIVLSIETTTNTTFYHFKFLGSVKRWLVVPGKASYYQLREVDEKLFLLNAASSVHVFDASTDLSRWFVDGFGSPFGTGTMVSSSGRQIVATQRFELARPAEYYVAGTINEILCSSSSCPLGMVCSIGTCIEAPPASAPASTSECTGPRPVQDATCVGGRWVIQGNVVVNSTIVIGGDTTINGSIILAPNATIRVLGTAVLEVANCATFAGILEVSRPAPATTVVDSNITVITFSGYCGGTTTKFNSILLNLTNQENCAKVSQANPVYNDVSLAIVFSYDRSGCSNDSVVSPLSPGAIAGIVVGAVVLIAIIIAILLTVRYKRTIRPFASRNSERETTDAELE